MTDSTTPQNSAAMSPASSGFVAGGVIEHAKKCVDFWRSMMDGADRIGMEAPSLAIGGVSDLVDGLLAEIARLTAERDAAILERRAAQEEAEDWSRRCSRILDARDAARAEAERLKTQIVALEGQSRMESEAEIAVEAAWERCGITPHWPDDEAGSSQRYAASMETEIGRLRAIVAKLERAYSAECDARAQAHRELSELNDAIRERESGEERDNSYATASYADLFPDRADKMIAAPAANAGGEANQPQPQAMADLLNRLAQWDHMATAADGPYWVGEITKVLSGAASPQPPRGWLTAEEREASTEAMKCMTKLRRERDEANAECERLRVAHLRAVLARDRANEARGRIRSEWTRRGQALHAAQQAIGDLNARVAELEAAAPPRGWLTAEEREAVEMFIRMGEEHDDVDAECAAMKLRALLAREAPPRVRRPNPHVVITTVDARERIDRQWIASIRAAGGEVADE